MGKKIIKYLEGLNTLRFFAAFLVIIYHAHGSLVKIGLMKSGPVPILDKGVDAVDFFFTLSGFLITYLLLKEINQTGNVSIKKFYMRRALRIWPVYFAIVFFRFSLYGIVYKLILHIPDTDFPILNGFALYIFFLPNLAAIIYNVGLLHPLWSIGVEEQFYLFWAPLVKICKSNIQKLLVVMLFVSIIWYLLLSYNVFHFDPVVLEFFLSQKFYAMIVGAIFGYILFNFIDYYENSVFANKLFQYGVVAFLIFYFALSDKLQGVFWLKLIMPVVYALLILNVSSIKNKIFSLEKKPFIFLGEISYGLYMYHMVVDFFLRKGFQKLILYPINQNVLIATYFVLIIGGSVLLSYVSYKYFESWFLKIKHSFSTVEINQDERK
jgi:peptidoglycan/LPS O-acetylase OafA/YrhL